MDWLRLVFFLLPLALNGQHQVQGRVLDEDHQAIPGATITVDSLRIGVVSDADGHFLLSDLPEGRFLMEIRSVGMKPERISVQVPTSENLLVSLQESVLTMNEVVVTGTMKPTFVSQSPIKVDVFTSKHLTTYIPSASASIVDGVSLVNGVQEVVSCGVCFTNSISINGLPGPYTAVLIDGTPMYGNLASVYGLNGIPSMIIDRFEVIKGPSSTLYGSEAVAGVINIITRDPEEASLASADVMGTSHGEVFSNFAVAPKLGKAKGILGLNHGYVNTFEDENGDGFSDLINLDRISLFTKWDIERESGKRFTISGKYYYEDRRNGVEAFLRDRDYRELRGSSDIYGESIYTSRLELFGTYELPLNEKFRVDYSFSQHEQDSYYGSDFYEASQRIGFLNFVWDKKIKRHSMLAGFTARYQDYDDNTVATEVLRDNTVENHPDTQFIPGIFLQDEWSISDRTTLLGGFRLDYYNRHGLIFAPRINLKWKPEEWTTVRLNLGTGFRVVNLFTEDHAFVTGQREVRIEEELQPEESYNLSLNMNHVYVLGRGQGMIDIDVFYTYFTNKIIPNYDSIGFILYGNTDGYAVSRGIGISLTHEFGFPLSLNLGVNVQEVKESESVRGDQLTRKVEFAPAWTGLLTANYRIDRWKMVIGYTWQHTGAMALPEVFDLNIYGVPLSNPRPTRSNPFSMHNVQVSKEFSDRFSIYGGVQNLFNYIQPWSPLVGFNDPVAKPGFSDNFDTSYAYSPIHGREVYLGLSWKL